MKRIIFLVSIVICFLLVIGGIFSFFRQPDPQKLVFQGLDNLSKANSFSYSLTQQQTVDGQERLLTKITGIKSGENIHIQGQLAGSEVEMIKVGHNLYNKDPFSKEWIEFSNVTVAQEVFLVELDPLATLQIKEMGEVMLRGQEEVNGKKSWVCTLKPSIQNQMMERFWSDFEYTIYISKSSKNVVKAEVKAYNKETEEPMTIILEFKDFGRKISIQPPTAAK
ncbi:MAG: hypothetical protein APF84_06995 [Gracilibacter sp. BRH_c7a]|nr:MAG: hypothetical protein APF84_06995 [Gracilibacter sp. BRH_c7a]